MSMSVGGFNANFNIASQNVTAKKGQTGQNGVPAFDSGRVWGSLGAFGNGLMSYQKEWEGEYENRFSGLENDGKLSVDEMKEQLQSEFAQYGVRFVNSNPRDVTDGQHKVYIDDANMEKMANNPEYRGKVMALMQRELANTQQGFSYQRNGQAVDFQMTGSVISISQENSGVGGIPYAGMGRGASTVSQSRSSVGTASNSASGTKKGKSMLEIIKEMQEEREEKLELKREKEKLEAEKKAREEQQLTVEPEVSADVDGDAIAQSGVAAKPSEGGTATPGAATTGSSLDVVG